MARQSGTQPAPQAAQLALDLLTPLAPSLDNFVVGSNAEVLAILRAVARGAGPQFVHLWGDPGSGRSHLLRALACATAVGDRPVAARVPAFDPGCAVHVVDDVDDLDSAGQAALFALQDAVRAEPAARLVTAGSRSPAATALREDVRTRLGWGPSYRLEPLSDQDQAQALRAHVAARGGMLADDLIHHLLVHRTRNLGQLVALLDELDGYALAQQRPLGIALLRQWQAQAEVRQGAQRAHMAQAAQIADEAPRTPIAGAT